MRERTGGRPRPPVSFSKAGHRYGVFDTEGGIIFQALM